MSKNSEALKRRSAESEEFTEAYTKEVQKLDLADLLFQLRQDSGLNQTDFAKKVKKSRSTIARIEAGRVEPTISLLEDIAKALGKQLDIRFIEKQR